MNAAAPDLLADLTRAGVKLEPHGDKLRVKAPSGFLTPEMKERLKANKSALLAALKANHDELLRRCNTACRGLPVSPGALLAELCEEDKTAIRSGDPDEIMALRTFAECLAERTKPALDSEIEAAYRWCRAELARRPEIHRAVCTVDPDGDPVLLAVAVRGVGCVTLKVERANYEGREFELLEMLHRADVAESDTTKECLR